MKLVIKIQINTSSGAINQSLIFSGTVRESQEVLRRLQARESLAELQSKVHFRLPPIGACRHLAGSTTDTVVSQVQLLAA